MDRRTKSSPILAAYPPPERYAFAVDEYLEHIRRVKQAVAIPVVGSLNGVTREAWLSVARDIEQAGADALELNIYEVAADPADSASAIEARIRDVTGDLKSVLSIPVAVKLSPYFTAFGHVARSLDGAGADGLVLFNRFYQPDLDVESLDVQRTLRLSDSSELPLRLRWLAILSGAGFAGAHRGRDTGGQSQGHPRGRRCVQLVSAILRNGPAFFDVMRRGRQMDGRQGSRRLTGSRRVRVDDFRIGARTRHLSPHASELAGGHYGAGHTATDDALHLNPAVREPSLARNLASTSS